MCWPQKPNLAIDRVKLQGLLRAEICLRLEEVRVTVNVNEEYQYWFVAGRAVVADCSVMVLEDVAQYDYLVGMLMGRMIAAVAWVV